MISYSVAFITNLQLKRVHIPQLDWLNWLNLKDSLGAFAMDTIHSLNNGSLPWPRTLSEPTCAGKYSIYCRAWRGRLFSMYFLVTCQARERAWYNLIKDTMITTESERITAHFTKHYYTCITYLTSYGQY